MAWRRRRRWILPGLVFALFMSAFVWGFTLNADYEVIARRLETKEQEDRVTRVYVNDLWKRVTEAGIKAPPPPWTATTNDGGEQGEDQ